MLSTALRQFLRGGLAPAHVYASVLLGGLLGLIPAYGASPGLLVTLLFAWAVLRVNGGLLALAGLAAKALLLLALPLATEVGQTVLEGPAGGMLQSLAQAPVLAWFGLERYDLIGALTLGLPLLVVLAFLTNQAVQRLRRLARSGAENPAFEALASGRLGRFSLVLLLGPGGREALRRALYDAPGLLRWKGAAVGLGALAVLLPLSTQGLQGLAEAQLRPTLERLHGATVDLESVTFEPFAGALTLQGLALADPDALETNLFEAEALRLELSLLPLLAKRIELKHVSLAAPRVGYPRATPGVRLGPLLTPPTLTLPPEQNLGAYVENAERWLERLQRLQEWLAQWERDARPPPAPGTPAYDEWLAERLAEKGYAAAVHPPLAEAYWGLRVERAQLQGIALAALDGAEVDLLLSEIADQPRRTGRPPRLSLRSALYALEVDLALHGLVEPAPHALALSAEGVPLAPVLAALRPEFRRLASGGTVALSLDGTVDPARTEGLALTFTALLRDLTLTLKGKSVPVAVFEVPARLHGSLAQPRIELDQPALQGQLRDLAKGAVKEAVREKVEDKVREKLGKRLKGLVPGG